MSGLHRIKQHMQASLTKRLLFFFLATTLIPVLVVGTLEYINARHSLQDSKKQQLLAVNMLITSKLETYYHTLFNNLFISADYTAHFLTQAVQENRLSQALKHTTSTEYFTNILQHNGYKNIIITDHKAQLLLTLGDPLREENQFLLKKSIQQTLLDGEWHHTLNTKHPDHKDSFFTLPILNKKKQTIGTITIGTNAVVHTQNILEESEHIDQLFTSYLIQKDAINPAKKQNIIPNLLVQQQQNITKIQQIIKQNPAVLSALKTHAHIPHTVFEYTNTHHETLLGTLHYFDVAGVPMVLVTEVPKATIFFAINQLGHYVFWLILLVALIMGTISTFLAVHLSHPIKRLIKWSEQVAAGNFATIEPLTYKDEIGALSQSFSMMTEKLRIMYHHNEERLWLQNGLISLNDLLKYNTELDAQRIISWLCCYAEADYGSLSTHSSTTKAKTFSAVFGNDEGYPYTYNTKLIFRTQTVGMLQIKASKPFSLKQKNFFNLITESLAISFYNLELHNQLKINSQYKSKFLANVSHELRSPLHSMIMLSDILAENKTENLTSEQILSAQTIHRVGNELLHVINDILDLSKVEAGKIEIHKDFLNLKEMLTQLETQFAPLAQQKNMTFTIDCLCSVESIYTDRHRLIQILQNMLSNALKFTPASGSVQLSVKPTKKGTTAISVTDTGPGIPVHLQKNIFQAFTQIDNSHTRTHQGTGLGLSISKQLAKLLGGVIQLHSTPNQGSCFTLVIPTEAPPMESESSLLSLPAPTKEDSEFPHLISCTTHTATIPHKFKEQCILIVEKNLKCAFYLSGLFESLGAKVTIANTHEMIKDKIQHIKPDIILVTDLGIPLFQSTYKELFITPLPLKVLSLAPEKMLIDATQNIVYCNVDTPSTLETVVKNIYDLIEYSQTPRRNTMYQ